MEIPKYTTGKQDFFFPWKTRRINVSPTLDAAIAAEGEAGLLTVCRGSWLVLGKLGQLRWFPSAPFCTPLLIVYGVNTSTPPSMFIPDRLRSHLSLYLCSQGGSH